MHTTMISTPFGGRERYVSGVGPTWQELSMARLSQKRFLDKWWKDELSTVKKSISKDMDNLGPAKYAMGGIPNIENDLKDDWYKVLAYAFSPAFPRISAGFRGPPNLSHEICFLRLATVRHCVAARPSRPRLGRSRARPSVSILLLHACMLHVILCRLHSLCLMLSAL